MARGPSPGPSACPLPRIRRGPGSLGFGNGKRDLRSCSPASCPFRHYFLALIGMPDSSVTHPRPPMTPRAEDLLPLVYNELRQLAQAAMRPERPSHTLQPTALVHEAFLRLAASDV